MIKKQFMFLAILVFVVSCAQSYTCETGEEVKDSTECPFISKTDAVTEVENYITFFEDDPNYPETSSLRVTNVYTSEDEYLGEMVYSYIDYVTVPGKDEQDKVNTQLTFVLHINKFTGQVKCLNVLEKDLELCGRDVYDKNKYR